MSSLHALLGKDKRFGDTLPKQLALNAVRSNLFLDGSQERRSTLLENALRWVRKVSRVRGLALLHELSLPVSLGESSNSIGSLQSSTRSASFC